VLGNKTSAKAVIEPVAPLRRNKEEINKNYKEQNWAEIAMLEEEI